MITAIWNFRISYVIEGRARIVAVLPDEEVVRTFQETGGNDCFAELFARHRQRVYSACRRFFTDSATAEDAVQEAFLRAYRNIKSFHGGNFLGWLMKITRNACIDLWRKIPEETDSEDDPLPDLPEPGALESSPDMHLAVEQIWQEMSSLTPEQRLCLEMIIEGYSYEETAVRTGFPLKAVKSHIQNGRRMLWLKMEGVLY
jgi:RNA polymerase sigma-70 factor (ECF subfamily)